MDPAQNPPHPRATGRRSLNTLFWPESLPLPLGLPRIYHDFWPKCFSGDKAASEQIYPILRQVLKKADIGINVGYAIVYECVRTAIAIFPSPDLIEAAASSISRFILSQSHNLKYLGINALASIVQIDSKFAVDHQMTVIDCLEDPDETLRRKTLDLLYSMTNPQNVRVIMKKLVSHLRSTVDTFVRTELVSRTVQIAEKYAPDAAWYIISAFLFILSFLLFILSFLFITSFLFISFSPFSSSGTSPT
jgi:hypothetical protein